MGTQANRLRGTDVLPRSVDESRLIGVPIGYLDRIRQRVLIPSLWGRLLLCNSEGGLWNTHSQPRWAMCGLFQRDAAFAANKLRHLRELTGVRDESRQAIARVFENSAARPVMLASDLHAYWLRLTERECSGLGSKCQNQLVP